MALEASDAETLPAKQPTGPLPQTAVPSRAVAAPAREPPPAEAAALPDAGVANPPPASGPVQVAPAAAPTAVAAALPGARETSAPAVGEAQPSPVQAGPAAPAAGAPYIVRSDVQYRDGPSMSANVLGFLYPRQRILVAHEDAGWLAFHFPNEPAGKAAWVSRYFVTPADVASQ